MLNLQCFRGRKFLHNYGNIKQYGENRYKVTVLRSYRQRGLVVEDRPTMAKGEANSEKLSNNLSRSKATIFELAYCNPWEYFCTFTLDKSKYDRYDLKTFVTDFTQALRDYRKKHQCEIKYLFIPERHQDGAWHLHGFMMGIPSRCLEAFKASSKLPLKIKKRLAEGKTVYTWPMYQEKFGFADLEKIENHEAASKYITKYITADIRRTITEVNAHIFYASKGLEKSKLIYENYLKTEIDSPDFQNDYVTVKTVFSEQEAKRYFE